MPLSRFLRTLERNGIVAVFHGLVPAPIFLTKEDWESYQMNPEASTEITSALGEAGLIISSPSDDDELLENIRQSTVGMKLMSILYLILTKQCNFRCRQCFQEERHPDLYPELAPTSQMTEEVAKRAIDAFVRHLAESEAEALEPQIQFYGGEPLLNLKTLRAAVRYIEELRAVGSLPADIRLVIVTNGSRINDELARYFADHQIGIGLSVDGPASANDEYRRTANGRGTFASIERALRTLQRHGVTVTLSVTVNPNIVAKLPEIMRWAKEEMGVESIAFNAIGGKSFAYTRAPMTVARYNQLLATGMVDAFETARTIGLYEDRVGRKINDFINEDFRAVDCGAVGNQLVAFPDGGLGFCHASENYQVGTVFDTDFRIFNHPEVEQWRAALPLNQSHCLACPAISVCGYGCFHNVLENGQPLESRDIQFCLHSRTVMEFLVWDLYEKTTAQK